VNAAALLALIGDLYSQVAQLTDENRKLHEILATNPKDAASTTA
jgi:hypothetical protein